MMVDWIDLRRKKTVWQEQWCSKRICIVKWPFAKNRKQTTHLDFNTFHILRVTDIELGGTWFIHRIGLLGIYSTTR